MPGSICVSVLEAFDLPATIADGEDVAIKVAVGTREYQTAPSKAVGGKTTPWSLDFVFPVLNLRDNLVVLLLDENGNAISKNEIDTPSIVEQGSFEVNLLLNGGGNIHLSLSFVLTDEERRRIDVMRAAALKRREQQASKSSASMQMVLVEGESENKSSKLHLASVGSLERDIEEAGMAKDSPVTTSQDSDVSQLNKSEPLPQDTHQESLICVEPVGKLDKADPINQDVLDKTLYESVEGACDSHPNSYDCGGESDKSTSLGCGDQEPIGILDSTASVNNIQVAADEMAWRTLDTVGSAAVCETKSEAGKTGDLEKNNLPQTASEENRELLEELPYANVKAIPNSVKARIKAFEKTRPQGSTTQSHILPSSSKMQKLSPRSSKTSPSKNVEGEAEHAANTKEPFHDIETRKIEDEQPELANRMEGVEPNKSLFEENGASLGPSEAGQTTKEGECLHELTSRRTEDGHLEPVGHLDCVEPNDRNSEGERTSMASQKRDLEHQAADAEQPKDDKKKTSSMQENRHLNLMSLSKQVLSGALSGAVMIAAGALLWAANSSRRNSSIQQRSKQRKRK